MPDFLEELLQKLREAIADAGPDAVMRAAHSIKGELGYLGAAQATQAARELEDMRYGAKPRHWSVWVEKAVELLAQTQAEQVIHGGGHLEGALVAVALDAVDPLRVHHPAAEDAPGLVGQVADADMVGDRRVAEVGGRVRAGALSYRVPGGTFVGQRWHIRAIPRNRPCPYFH